MLTGGSGARIQVFQHQTDAEITQANPVSGTQYTVLDTTKNVRIIGIEADCTWTVQPNPLEIHIIADGETITLPKANPVSTTNYFARLRSTNANEGLSTTDLTIYRAFLIEGRSVKVTAEITGGTVQQLHSVLQYAKVP